MTTEIVYTDELYLCSVRQGHERVRVGQRAEVRDEQPGSPLHRRGTARDDARGHSLLK